MTFIAECRTITTDEYVYTFPFPRRNSSETFWEDFAVKVHSDALLVLCEQRNDDDSYYEISESEMIDHFNESMPGVNDLPHASDIVL